MAERYMDALLDYAGVLIDREFPQDVADTATRDIARKIVLGAHGDAADRAAYKYAGLGGFASAVLDGRWEDAAFMADSQNALLLASWAKFRYWVAGKAEELSRGATVGEDGLRYMAEG